MSERREERILVLAPLGPGGTPAVRSLVQAGLPAETCPDLSSLVEKVGSGAGALLLAEEGILDDGLERLRDRLVTQEPWSALPLVVLTSRSAPGPEAARALRRIESFESVTFLERPVRTMTLISTMRAALDSRRRQYVLRDLLRRLEGQVRQRDEFLALLGHELRNPLAAVRSATEILKGGGDGETHDAAVAILDRQGTNLSRMVDELLDVSRVTRGKIRLALEPLELREILRQAAGTFRAAARDAGVQIELELEEGPHVVRADATRLEQVFSNLIHNALKFTRPGGRIVVSLDGSGEGVRVRVRDDGVGMDSRDLERVFDMFAQSERSLDRAPGGLGIGLTLVRRLVEMHGGRISARSDGPGRGSEFRVTLPVAGNEAVAPGERGPDGPPKARPGPASDLSVLLVDDNPDIAESMSLLLRMRGYLVRTAVDGETALRAVEEGRPDVVLLDIGLPGLDGFEVARRIRTRRGGREIRIVAVTGYGQESDRTRAERAGFDGFLVKPVRADALLDLLAEEASARSGAPDGPRK